jgi:superfamily I DNA and/or RNA helicase
MNPEKIKENILNQTPLILCTTLSMAGIGLVKETYSKKIDYLIIDEACQSIEPSTLIPLELEPKRVILVGDQK